MPTENKTILVIDDDRLFCLSVEHLLKTNGTRVLIAHSGASGIACCEREPVDLVLLDQNLPDCSGASLCPAILRCSDQTKIIFITAQPTFASALEAIRNGAFDYLAKPFESAELSLVIERALRIRQLESIEQIHRYQTAEEAKPPSLVGDSDAMRKVRRLVGLAGNVNTTVLITGETGVGKNAVAHAIHCASQVKGPFIRINCGALPAHLIEAELFGHEKGAFTGATVSRRGVFELAENGTLFLDEIAVMPPSLQASLLGVLDDHTMKRIGGQSIKRITARIVVATNADLDIAVRAREFREDLYHRLNILRIHIPPLREHREDVPPLAYHFLAQLTASSHHDRPCIIGDEEIDLMTAYHWPGNIRELRNVIERAIITSGNHMLSPSLFLNLPMIEQPPALPVPPAAPEALATLEQLEEAHIHRAVISCGGNCTRAAQILGISLSTLRRKLKTIAKPADSSV